jgi:hypothetical protein
MQGLSQIRGHGHMERIARWMKKEGVIGSGVQSSSQQYIPYFSKSPLISDASICRAAVYPITPKGCAHLHVAGSIGLVPHLLSFSGEATMRLKPDGTTLEDAAGLVGQPTSLPSASVTAHRCFYRLSG